jgi:hypothetical protein
MWIGVFKGSEVTTSRIKIWQKSQALKLNVVTSPKQFQDEQSKWTHLVMDSDADTTHFYNCTGLQSPADLPRGGTCHSPAPAPVTHHVALVPLSTYGAEGSDRARSPTHASRSPIAAMTQSSWYAPSGYQTSLQRDMRQTAWQTTS